MTISDHFKGKAEMLNKIKKDQDMELKIHNAILNKSEELETYLIKLDENFDSSSNSYQSRLQNLDAEQTHPHSEFKHKIFNEFKLKAINVLMIVTMMFLALETIVSGYMYVEYSLVDLNTNALTYYTVDVVIAFFGRFVTSILIIIFIGRLFIISKVFKLEDISLKFALFERQFFHYLTCSLYNWCIMLSANIWYDIYFDPMKIHHTYGLERPHFIKYSIIALDYSWFFITGVSFVFYLVVEVMRFVSDV